MRAEYPMDGASLELRRTTRTWRICWSMTSNAPFVLDEVQRAAFDARDEGLQIGREYRPPGDERAQPERTHGRHPREGSHGGGEQAGGRCRRGGRVDVAGSRSGELCGQAIRRSSSRLGATGGALHPAVHMKASAEMSPTMTRAPSGRSGPFPGEPRRLRPREAIPFPGDRAAAPQPGIDEDPGRGSPQQAANCCRRDDVAGQHGYRQTDQQISALERQQREHDRGEGDTEIPTARPARGPRRRGERQGRLPTSYSPAATCATARTAMQGAVSAPIMFSTRSSPLARISAIGEAKQPTGKERGTPMINV